MSIESTHSDGDSIACPYCKESWADLWDYDWGNSQEAIETECPYCSREITLCIHVRVDYSCYPGWKSSESSESSDNYENRGWMG